MTDKPAALLLFGATGDLARRMLLPSLYGLDCRRAAARRACRSSAPPEASSTTPPTASAPHEALEEHLPAGFYDPGGRATVSQAAALRRRSTATSPEGFARLAEKVGDPAHGLAIFLSTAPSLFEPTIDGLAAAGLAGPTRPHGAGKAARHRPRLEPRDQRRGRRSPSPRSAPSASTIISARRRSRTCSRCASPTRCSSRCGTRPTSTMSRSPSPRPSGSRAAAIITTAPARCATWSRTTCCSCWRWWRWSRRPISTRPRCATRRSRCCARCGRSDRGDDRRPCRHRPIWRAARSAARPCPAMPRSSAATATTETFVALKAHVDNWRWKGVPFYLRTGKRLPERQTEIFIQFKPRAALDLRRARRDDRSPTSWSSASSPRRTSGCC